MKIKDIKPGGWVRFSYDDGKTQTAEIAKVKEFHYDRRYANGYGFRFENNNYCPLFDRKDFKYSDNVAELIKNTERIVEMRGHYLICKSFTKDKFIKKYGDKNEIRTN